MIDDDDTDDAAPDTGNDLGRRIAAQRGRMDMSQEELASRACISMSYVTMLERGLRIPRWKRLAVIATALDTTPEWLMTGRALTSGEDCISGIRMMVESRRLTRKDVERIGEVDNLIVGRANFIHERGEHDLSKGEYV